MLLILCFILFVSPFTFTLRGVDTQFNTINNSVINCTLDDCSCTTILYKMLNTPLISYVVFDPHFEDGQIDVLDECNTKTNMLVFGTTKDFMIRQVKICNTVIDCLNDGCWMFDWKAIDLFLVTGEYL